MSKIYRVCGGDALSQQPPPLYQTIVVVDVASFTDPARTTLHHLAVREGLLNVLNGAFAEAGIDLSACVMEDRGDGKMILIPAEVDKHRLADQLPSRLLAGLRRHNTVHSAEAVVRLRVVLHAGDVYQDGHGAVSHAVNLACRLLDAPQAKSALRSSTSVLALIASDGFYHDVIAQDPAADPSAYRRIVVSVKETSTVAWLRLPDFPAFAEGEQEEEAPQQRTRGGAVAAIEIREAVVEALVGTGLAEDPENRSLLIQLIDDYVATPLMVAPRPASRDHLIELVNACARAEGGLAALARAVWMMRPGSPESARISRLIDEPHVLDLLPGRELQRLREWLIMITIPELRALVHRAAIPGISPAWRVTNAWEAFSHLAEFNAGPDGFPPALMFVELVAHQVGGEVSTHLMGWNDDQARRLRLESQLRKRRSHALPIPVGSRLYLVIVVEPDAIDSNRYLVSYWRQDDASVWPPARGETRVVTFDGLEQYVDDLVVSAERAWSGHLGPVALEFVLPRPLLTVPVHLWHKEHDSGDPRPLCLDYPVVLRSLERMQSPHWHRVWHLRWQVLMNDPSAVRIHFGQPADTAERHRIDAILSDPWCVLMVLTAEPPRQPRAGGDELAAALRSGLPALLWHPEMSSDDLREIVTRLVDGDGLGDLPGRAQASRQAAFQASTAPFDVNITRDLVVLWDDPHRLVILDQQPDQPQRGWEIADEC
jgi:vWA-MoxR associated protein C-terminal domain/vWA-MoxR associated protein middle region 0/Effector-associated domain 2